MVRVMEGKIIEKWSERKQKLLQFRGKLIQVSVMFELARVRAIGMTRRFDFARSALNITDHTRFLFYICLSFILRLN